MTQPYDGALRAAWAWAILAMALPPFAGADADAPAGASFEYRGCQGIQGDFTQPLSAPAIDPAFRVTARSFAAALQCDHAALDEDIIQDVTLFLYGVHVLPPPAWQSSDVSEHIWVSLHVDNARNTERFWALDARAVHTNLTYRTQAVPPAGQVINVVSERRADCQSNLDAWTDASTTFTAGASRARLYMGTTGTNAQVEAVFDVDRSPFSGETGVAKFTWPNFCGTDVPWAVPLWVGANALYTGQATAYAWPASASSLRVTHVGPGPTANDPAASSPLEKGQNPKGDEPAPTPDEAPPGLFQATTQGPPGGRAAFWMPLTVAAGVALYVFRFHLGKALVAPLFTRIERDSALAHERRALLLAAIAAHPGVSFAQLRRRTGIGSGALWHHLRVLENTGHVRAMRIDGHTALYPAGHDVTAAAPAFLAVRRAILGLVEETPGIDQASLAHALGLDRKSVAYHVRRMESQGTVATRVDGRRRRHFPPLRA